MLLVFLLLFAFIAVKADSTSIEYERCLQPYCCCLSFKLSCTNFTSFTQLDFKRTNRFLYESVELVPLRQLDLDRSLNFDGLHLHGTLILSKIKSISPFYNPFKAIRVSSLFSLFLSNSSIGINTAALSSTQLQTITSCSNFGSKNDEFTFSGLRLSEFRLCNIHFPHQICPALFTASTIEIFNIISPLGVNFGFRPMATSNSNSPTVAKLMLNYAPGEPLPENITKITQINSVDIVNSQIFADIDTLELSNLVYLNEIEETTFKSFKHLKKLEIYDINLKRILLNSRRWLGNLNTNENYDLDKYGFNETFNRNRVFVALLSTEQYWTFKNDDLCLFRYFPHNSLVYPLLLYTDKSKIECNCVTYWLYKYLYRYRFLFQINSIFMPVYCFDKVDYENEIKKCQFETVFSKCVDGLEPTTATTTRSTSVFSSFSPITPFTTISSSSTTKTTTSMDPTKTTLASHNSTTSFTLPATHPTIIGVVEDEKYRADYLRQSRTNFIIAISLLVIIIVVIIVLIFIFYRTYFSLPSSKTGKTRADERTNQTPSLSISTIEAEEVDLRP